MQISLARGAVQVLCVAWLVSGCSWASRTSVAVLDQSRREPAQPWTSHIRIRPRPLAAQRDVEVFLDGKRPARACREIALFTVDGQLREEPDAVTGFIDLARRYGADALLVERPSATVSVDTKANEKAASESVPGPRGTAAAAEEKTHAEARLLRPEERALFRALAVVYTESAR